MNYTSISQSRKLLKNQCYYGVENPDEWVRLCEDDGDLSYAPIKEDGSVDWPDSYYERLKEEKDEKSYKSRLD